MKLPFFISAHCSVMLYIFIFVPSFANISQWVSALLSKHDFPTYIFTEFIQNCVMLYISTKFVENISKGFRVKEWNTKIHKGV